MTFSPAAADTIKTYLEETRTKPDDYDMIITGDLGKVGSNLLCQLLEKDSIDITKNHFDCGLNIYNNEKQETPCGASGCGCSAVVMCSRVLRELSGSLVDNVLFCATGSLHSPTTVFQGRSIPGIAHLVHLQKKS